jgi:hypothetical protein
VIIGVAVADLTRQPFEAGLQAQNGERDGSTDSIHRKDGFRECANFVRLAMSRIQSIARSNFGGRHPVPSVALFTQVGPPAIVPLQRAPETFAAMRHKLFACAESDLVEDVRLKAISDWANDTRLTLHRHNETR